MVVSYNSTKPGLPFPMMASKLSGVRSITLDALTTVKKAAKNDIEKRMTVEGRDKGCGVDVEVFCTSSYT
jgi:hypothetical protein